MYVDLVDTTFSCSVVSRFQIYVYFSSKQNYVVTLRLIKLFQIMSHSPVTYIEYVVRGECNIHSLGQGFLCMDVIILATHVVNMHYLFSTSEYRSDKLSIY